MSKQKIADAARELAIDLERRGSMEGHYVWEGMLQRALDAAAAEGRRKGLREAAQIVLENYHENDTATAKDILSLINKGDEG